MVYIACIGERFINYPIINILNIPKDSFFLVPLFFFCFHYFLYTLHPKSAPWALNWWKEDISELPEDRINFFFFVVEWGWMFSPGKVIRYLKKIKL